MNENCLPIRQLGCVLIILAMVSEGWTQEPPKPDPQVKSAPQPEQAPEPLGQLPEPLNEMSANLIELEQTGYFKLVKVEFGRTRFYNEEALLWTVRVVKPIHCRHAMLLLDRIADVRFYRTSKNHRTELHMAQLYYPSWIETDAANGRSMDRDEEFQIWVHLDHELIHRLDINKADTIEFTRMIHGQGMRRKRIPE